MARKVGVTAALALALVLAIALPAAAQKSQGRYDAQIQTDVTKKLQGHDNLKNVQASVEDGIVDLTGTVKLYQDKLQADRLAHHVEHAQGVRNDITVQPANISDAQLQQELADKLRYDRVGMGIQFNNFALNVNHGVVTIAGQARTPWDHDSALSILASTPGVTDVIDDVKVLPTSPMDDQLRLQVERAIYSDPAMQKYAMDPQAPIRIIVDNGHVTLYGVVDSQMDKTIAETRAKSVPGAFSVTDNLMIAGKAAQK